MTEGQECHVANFIPHVLHFLFKSKPIDNDLSIKNSWEEHDHEESDALHDRGNEPHVGVQDALRVFLSVDLEAEGVWIILRISSFDVMPEDVMGRPHFVLSKNHGGEKSASVVVVLEPLGSYWE